MDTCKTLAKVRQHHVSKYIMKIIEDKFMDYCNRYVQL